MTDLTRIEPASALQGTLDVPPDKSISHRAALVALLSETTTTIDHYLPAGDTLATLKAIEAFGAHVERAHASTRITGVGLTQAPEPEDVIDAHNSGTLIRIILGIAAGYGNFACFTGDSSLRRRPMRRVVGPLRGMGAEIWGVGGGERLPLAVIGNGGGLRGGEHEIPVASAQVKSCLLFAGLFADGPVSVVEPGRSRDHTERLLGACGAGVAVWDLPGGKRRIRVEPQERLVVPAGITVPGDVSSAAFWVAAALIVAGSEVHIRRVGLNPTRSGFLDILRRMGAEVEASGVREDSALGEPVGELVVRHSKLEGTRVGAEDVPGAVDELPILALVAAFAEGETVVEGAGELRVKETDRISAVCEEFSKVGVEIEEREDGFLVRGTGTVKGGRANSRGDHRLAMGLAVAGLASREGVEVEDMAASAVSYPEFLEDLETVACW
ncbi:MAG: 3-phosphoshikimate 1-carboxyvinyltransferase [Actinomycetota bacterium]|nr:3-phosphoshikimate 1-carboxyvinyltransferase [Actinomycetota bacterium]